MIGEIKQNQLQNCQILHLIITLCIVCINNNNLQSNTDKFNVHVIGIISYLVVQRFLQWPRLHCCKQKWILDWDSDPGLVKSPLQYIDNIHKYYQVVITFFMRDKQNASCFHLPMQGLTCWKQALVKSPSKANELCLTSGILSWKSIRVDKLTFLSTTKMDYF